MTDPTESITDAVTHLHNLLQTKERKLIEREADFARRVKLFESTNPSMGNDNDVIQLNVGGRTNIAVLRSLLTQFEGSMLAAKFSGRWDDSMEKDRDGNIFVDQDPDNFMILIDYLRMRMNNQLKHVLVNHRPNPTYKLCTMLEYYNLMPGVYSQTWVGGEQFVCEEIAYGTVTLSSQEGERATVLHPSGEYRNMSPQVLEFAVEFDKGASGAVGWIRCKDEGKDSKVTCSFNEALANALFLNIEERIIFGPEAALDQNMRINHNESSTKVICKRSGIEGEMELSIEVLEDAKAVANLPKSCQYDLLPVIQFMGKVTVSGIKYAIDQLPTGSKNSYD
eukprot:CAMPEP_0201716398 /NCGR_PEP_ID=MMETSP0593-20130828/2375_1 /ASSEMBLY_ACC=CAM_ASM_000672 /TAXON_ID=267983 /ORGANISM="Skeletonema japonicum, Strain CCMP2506" /LENGTH=336 /DNA_ID=CAMNT_0048206189 /DNA_START=1051 /DNA_END=2061 /DNA_ORIENTATION=+